MRTMREYLSTAEGVGQMWEKVNGVLDEFDFSAVKVTMDALDWGWSCGREAAERYEEEGCRVKWPEDGEDMCLYYPECPQIYKFARNLIINTVRDMPDDEERWSVSTGGFKVEVAIVRDEDTEGYGSGVVADEPDDFEHRVDITLYFIVEESASY